jgi:lipoprotein-anchoring transpeptidase ErfK/SrfK
MAKGRHTPKRRTRALIVVASVAAVLVVALGGAAYSAYRYEQSHGDTILPGVTIEGVDVGGLTRPEAVEAVRVAAAVRLEVPITVAVAGKTWSVTPMELGRRANAVAAVNQALGVSDSMDTFSRFWHRFRSDPVDRQIELAYAGDAKIEAFLGRVAKDVVVKPVDAAIAYQDHDVAFIKPKPGRALDFTAATKAVRNALKSGTIDRVALETLKVAPKVTAKNLGRNIVVRVDQNKLYVYDGFKVIRTFGVATAKPGYTTPAGDWKITRKAVNPTWYNPALDSWGADLPAVIPGGPTAPMGTRAIYIDEAPGLIRIHGTPSDDSIGRYASHGCIRMHNYEIEQLYPMIPLGARVIIVGTRPAGAVEGDTPASFDI